MIKIGYYIDGSNSSRVHIKDYNKEIHKGKIYCADGHHIIGKKGSQRQSHYSHLQGENCHVGSKMGEWHIWWQSRVKESNLEVRFRKDDILKIADTINCVNNVLYIIEFQKSVMSKDEMKLREKFYTRRDLLSHYNCPDSTSKLFWIFDLTTSDIKIDKVFGDVICFRFIKGSKFMLNSKCDGNVTTYYDLGKRQLIKIHKIKNKKFCIGTIVELSTLDKTLFKDIIKPNMERDLHREDEYDICEYTNINNDESRQLVIQKCKKYYFDRNLSVKEKDILSLL